MEKHFSRLRTNTKALSMALLFVFLAGCFVLIPHTKGASSYDSLKSHFGALLHPVVASVEPVASSLAHIMVPLEAYPHHDVAVASWTVFLIFLYKAFFISAYERNLFYVYTSINAP